MCLSPILVPVTKCGQVHYIQVSCGKCLECKARYTNDWKIRLTHHFEATGYNAVFFTLTYDEDTVPIVTSHNAPLFDGRFIEYRQDGRFKSGRDGIVRTCRKRDVQLMIKRFRERYQRSHDGKRLDFTYFICSEYGAKGRPHYHGIFFGKKMISCLFSMIGVSSSDMSIFHK